MNTQLVRKFRLGASKDEIDEIPINGYGSKDSRDAEPLRTKNFYGEPAPTQT